MASLPDSGALARHQAPTPAPPHADFQDVTRDGRQLRGEVPQLVEPHLVNQREALDLRERLAERLVGPPGTQGRLRDDDGVALRIQTAPVGDPHDTRQGVSDPAPGRACTHVAAHAVVERRRGGGRRQGTTHSGQPTQLIDGAPHPGAPGTEERGSASSDVEHVWECARTATGNLAPGVAPTPRPSPG